MIGRAFATAVLFGSTVAQASFEDSRAPAASLPTLVREGPYGEPFRLQPPVHPLGFEAEPVGVGGTGELRIHGDGGTPGRRDLGAARVRHDGTERPDDDEDDEEHLPARPGSFKRGFVLVPTPIPEIRPRPGFGPHLKPDTEIGLSRSTSLGLFGDVSTPESSKTEPGRTETRGLNLPGLKGKEIGAGVSLQYRFGQ